MFEVTQNNQPEKKPFGKFGIFLVIFSFFCIAGLLYYYFSKPQSENIPAVSLPQEKTDEQKVKEDVELIKQGYVKSISGEIKEIGENKDKIVVVNNNSKEDKTYTVSINNKTTFHKIIPSQEEVIEIKNNNFNEDEIEIYENVSENKPVEVAVNELKVGYQVVLILPKFVKLEEETNFMAIKIIMSEKLKEGNEDERDKGSDLKTDASTGTQDISTNIETKNDNVNISESENIEVENLTETVNVNETGS